MIENLENEQWLPIDGFDGYEVSNYGRVKSLKGKEEKILKQYTTNYGYQLVGLCKNSKPKMLYIHRLVANAFINNSKNYIEVNHIDENKCNNHVSNLEWCDRKYNINYGTRNEKVSKQVIQLTLDNQIIKTWDSIMDVQRNLGYHNTHICKCCKGKLKSSYGYKWQYAT